MRLVLTILSIFSLCLTSLAHERPRCRTQQQRLVHGFSSFGPGIPNEIVAASCTASLTNPKAGYDPGTVIRIPVVVHIIMNDDGSQGVVTDDQVTSQIRILNEDFRAEAGTNGAPGEDAGIEFFLVTEDPDGNPSPGIFRYNNTGWFDDNGGYSANNWDPNRYMNIYTNSASGALGYVNALPADGNGSIVGTASDYVIIHWEAIGEDVPAPFNLGRTATHEVGHYLGLEHTFGTGVGDCTSATVPGCYSTGDLICDTNPEGTPNFGDCSAGNPGSCGSEDPIHNYMDYSDDACMNRFTREQLRRMRCTLASWRHQLPFEAVPSVMVAPQSTNVDLGETVNLSVEAIGTGPLTFQWRKDAVNVDGATSSTLQLSNIAADDFGSYDCVITGDAGSVTSPAANVAENVVVTAVVLAPSFLTSGTLVFLANVSCDNCWTSLYWVNMNTDETFGTNETTVFPTRPTEDTSYQLVIEGVNDSSLTIDFSIKVPASPVYEDPNGDGCNTIEDLWLQADKWQTEITANDDANGDGVLNLLDLIYIDTNGPPCP